MARKKLKLAWINNDSARRATFKKRKKGLLKKVSELSTLCGVEACAIVYGPYEPTPAVWPSLPDAHSVLTRFDSMPEIQQSKKMMNQEGFLKDRITKMGEQLKKQPRENRMKRMRQLMNQCLVGKGLQDVRPQELGDLSWVVEEKLRAVHDRIEWFKKSRMPAPHLVPARNEGTRMLVQVQMQLPMQRQMQMQIGSGSGSGGGNEADKTVGHLDMMEALQRYPWLMDAMNLPNAGGSFAVDDFNMPMGGYGAWPGTFR